LYTHPFFSVKSRAEIFRNLIGQLKTRFRPQVVFGSLGNMSRPVKR